MTQEKIWYFHRRSFIGRLLWPVNAISFFLIFGFSFFMAIQFRNETEQSLISKTESLLNFLQPIAQSYLEKSDSAVLGKITNNLQVDPDIESIIFFNQNNKAITEDLVHNKAQKTSFSSTLEKSVLNNKSQVIGKIVITYNTQHINQVFWRTMYVASVIGVLVQFLLSIAIFLVCRGIIRPLNDSIDKLSKTAHVLSQTSHDVSHFSESLSSGVNQQAEVVQETTSAMAEMTSTLNQTSNYAKQSEAVMNNMTQTAHNGMNIMNQMVDAMSSVQLANEQLRRMVEMIQEIRNKTNVINDIVFKTQLLSFNASIEAARAGQHGRGFAVVAEEVGNLAKMSGKAAQEISSLLIDSEKQVNEIVRNTSERVQVGRSVTEQALKNFKEIAHEVELISSRIANISTASREQELGIVQTTQAMRELNKTTELNNQVAQNSSATSHVLRTEIKALHSIARSISESIVGYAMKNIEIFEDHELQQTSDESSSNKDFEKNISQLSHEELTKKVIELAKMRSESASTNSEDEQKIAQ